LSQKQKKEDVDQQNLFSEKKFSPCYICLFQRAECRWRKKRKLIHGHGAVHSFFRFLRAVASLDYPRFFVEEIGNEKIEERFLFVIYFSNQGF